MAENEMRASEVRALFADSPFVGEVDVSKTERLPRAGGFWVHLFEWKDWWLTVEGEARTSVLRFESESEAREEFDRLAAG